MGSGEHRAHASMHNRATGAVIARLTREVYAAAGETARDRIRRDSWCVPRSSFSSAILGALCVEKFGTAPPPVDSAGRVCFNRGNRFRRRQHQPGSPMARGRALRFVTGRGVTRREWLRLGGMLGLGLALPGAVRGERARGARRCPGSARRSRCCSSSPAAGRARSTCGTPSPTPRTTFAARFAPSAPPSPAPSSANTCRASPALPTATPSSAAPRTTTWTTARPRMPR